MGSEVVQLTRRGFGKTMRRDAWWVQPLVVFIILSAFVIYATWAALQNEFYTFGNYLSPFYSWRTARLDSVFQSVLAGAPHPAASRGLQTHVLLLQGSVLQELLG